MQLWAALLSASSPAFLYQEQLMSTRDSPEESETNFHFTQVFPGTSNSHHGTVTQCIDSLVGCGRNIWIHPIKHIIQLILSRCKTKESQQAFWQKELGGKAKGAEKNCRKLDQVNRGKASITQWCLFCVNTAVHRHFCVMHKKGYSLKGSLLVFLPPKFWVQEWQVTFPIPKE